MHERRLLMVLGMHRSGTSALTRVLALWGAGLPEGLMPANFANQTGYWESPAIVTLHDRALEAAGCEWDDPGVIPPEWFTTDAARETAAALADAVRQEYGAADLPVVKDPRASRLLPLWQDASERLAAKPAALLAIRHPVEVAASLRERDGMPLPHALLLWLEHLVDAARAVDRWPLVVVSYDDLLRDWRGVRLRVESALGLTFPIGADESAPAVETFLNPDLRHARVSDGAAAGLPPTHWAVRAWQLVEAAAGGAPLRVDELEAVRAEARLECAPMVTSARWLMARARGHLAQLRDAERDKAHLADTCDRLARERSEAEAVAQAEHIRLQQALEASQTAHAETVAQMNALSAEHRAVAAERDAVAAELRAYRATRLGRLQRRLGQLRAAVKG